MLTATHELKLPAPRAILPYLVALILLASASVASHANTFTFSAKAPDFTITLPNIPPIVMGDHPQRLTMPHLRYIGSQGPYTVSVLTPTADAGMSAAECARSTIDQLSARPGAPPFASIYRVRINERTYAAIYGSPGQGQLILHAHFLSAAAGGSHCIEVHVSKVVTAKEDLEVWFKGFGSADIEAR